jgi:hypothetical protein
MSKPLDLPLAVHPQRTCLIVGNLVECRRRSSLITAISILLLISRLAYAQIPSPSQNEQRKQDQHSVPVAAPSPQPIVPPVPAQPLTLEQSPPIAPEVSWDGKLLSVKSKNSTLSTILLEVRARTHAVIDIPSGAGAERVVAQLGPASAREVLTSLLSGSNFNYVIVASDSDADAIQSVLLTPRGTASDSLTASGTASATGVRRMPGYVDSSRGVVPASQVEAQPEPSESFSSEPAVNSEAAAPAQRSASEITTAVSDGVQPSTDTQPAATAIPGALPGDPAAGTGSDSSAPFVTGASPVPAAEAGQPSTPSVQSVQDLQRLYEQRRQMQIQQNQNNSTPVK